MQTGGAEANLPKLNQGFRLPYIEDLIHRKREGAESAALAEADVGFFWAEFNRLHRELEEAAERTALPEDSSAKPALRDFVVRLRLGQVAPAHP
jgi:hypothetical protein